MMSPLDKGFTAWKVSVFGAFLVRIFPHSKWMQIISLKISVFSSNAGKYSPEKFKIRALLTQLLWLLSTFVNPITTKFTRTLKLRDKHLWLYLKLYLPCINHTWEGCRPACVWIRQHVMIELPPWEDVRWKDLSSPWKQTILLQISLTKNLTKSDFIYQRSRKGN